MGFKKSGKWIAAAPLWALLFASPLSAAQLGPARALPFIEDDYARALHEAKSRNVPLFVEAWAPW